MKPTKREPETPTEALTRRTRHLTEMRFVILMSGLEFYSEPISRERMLNRMGPYGYHPSNRITGLVRFEGRTGDGEWVTV